MSLETSLLKFQDLNVAVEGDGGLHYIFSQTRETGTENPIRSGVRGFVCSMEMIDFLRQLQGNLNI